MALYSGIYIMFCSFYLQKMSVKGFSFLNKSAKRKFKKYDVVFVTNYSCGIRPQFFKSYFE